MNILLLITTIGNALSVLVVLGLGIFVLVRSPKKASGVLFFAFNFLVALYLSAYTVGINIADPALSHSVFLFTLAFVLLPVVTLHWVYSVLGAGISKKIVLGVLYVLAVATVSFYLVFPEAYLHDSIQKVSYLANYYNPGPYFYLALCYFGVAFAWTLIVMLKAFFSAVGKERSRIVYFMGSIIFCYAAGSLHFFLAYDFSINPTWSVLIGLYAIPLTYAIFEYDLLGIGVAAKRSFFYTLAAGGVGGLILLVNITNNIIVKSIEGFPLWLMPLVSGVAVIAVAGSVWRQIRAVDELKYQFITVVTHKFRTPLTSIKWSAENLGGALTPEERARGVEAIRTSATRLEELTDRLVGITTMETTHQEYNFRDVDFTALIKEVLVYYLPRIAERKLAVVESLTAQPLVLSLDQNKIKFALQVLVENAITYSRPGGKIYIKTVDENKTVTLSVRDTGIGIQAPDMTHLFKKFFRTSGAKLADTEGMGIGLYLARETIKGHGGTLLAESEGQDKGTVFTIRLPRKRG